LLPVAAACIAVAAIAAAYLIGSRNTEKAASFTRLTFQRGFIKRARFAPDGQDVIYSATWEGRPFEIFSMKIGENSSRALGLADAMALGVSDNGEIALLANVHRVRATAFLYVGTLARAQDSGGTAREILDDVWDADISRDGKQFAVVRATGGPQQLEYPIGKVLFKTDGYISDPRISPDGKSVAFMEHPYVRRRSRLSDASVFKWQREAFDWRCGN
jgi:eukaryotic-like serine/threonine-protein kinase